MTGMMRTTRSPCLHTQQAISLPSELITRHSSTVPLKPSLTKSRLAAFVEEITRSLAAIVQLLKANLFISQ